MFFNCESWEKQYGTSCPRTCNEKCGDFIDGDIYKEHKEMHLLQSRVGYLPKDTERRFKLKAQRGNTFGLL